MGIFLILGAFMACSQEPDPSLAEAGKLILAGPFLGEGELRGIYVFDTPSIEEAEALTATDPAIKAGSLAMELNSLYECIQKVGITD